ncbi:MAG TPA: dodecin family protein [Pyrinomonadaceae bacterium]|nr:dodecin family protein [Pyrinomonadaceae bacterium]
MSVAKNIEIIATSNDSFDDAVKQGVERASRTIEHLRSAWVKEQKVSIVDGKVAEYRVAMILTFVLADDE